MNITTDEKEARFVVVLKAGVQTKEQLRDLLPNRWRLRKPHGDPLRVTCLTEIREGETKQALFDEAARILGNADFKAHYGEQ